MGKGGTGKSTVAAALSLLAARAGKRVLAVDVDAKGDTAAALGTQGGGFAPHVLQPGIHGIELHADESFQEYLGVYFKVPRLARLTPLSRVFDFIATGVPGPRDMLVVGKIAYEERRRERDGRPCWDIIVVDCAASGHAVSHLSAAHAMLTLVRGGIIRSQVQWIDQLVRDPARSAAVMCSLPEEMPVVEAIELERALRKEAGLRTEVCVLNRMVTTSVTPSQLALARQLCSEDHAEGVRDRLGGDPAPLLHALQLARQLHDGCMVQAKALRAGLAAPVIGVPLQTTRAGLATSRAVAEAIAGAAPW